MGLFGMLPFWPSMDGFSTAVLMPDGVRFSQRPRRVVWAGTHAAGVLGAYRETLGVRLSQVAASSKLEAPHSRDPKAGGGAGKREPGRPLVDFEQVAASHGAGDGKKKDACEHKNDATPATRRGMRFVQNPHGTLTRQGAARTEDAVLRESADRQRRKSSRPVGDGA